MLVFVLSLFPPTILLTKRANGAKIKILKKSLVKIRAYCESPNWTSDRKYKIAEIATKVLELIKE